VAALLLRRARLPMLPGSGPGIRRFPQPAALCLSRVQQDGPWSAPERGAEPAHSGKLWVLGPQSSRLLRTAPPAAAALQLPTALRHQGLRRGQHAGLSVGGF